MAQNLHCWHCAAPIDRSTAVCRACLTDLRQRDRAMVRFAVVGGEPRLANASGAVELVPAPSHSLGLIARHWRGDIPLDVAFWAVTCFGGLALFAIPYWLGVAIDNAGRDPTASRTAMLGLLIGTVLLVVVVP